MATYAIGDVHGCARTLDLLLGDLPFDAASDRLWMVGDLVNRGPDSLGVLRWARGQHEGLGDRFVTVLGNHDLHLIAAHLGVARRPQPDLDPILAADDGAELVAWLRRRPLLHRDGDTLLVHAGLWPWWTPGDAESWARRAEVALRGDDAAELLGGVKALGSTQREGGEAELARIATALFAFVHLRTLTADGDPCPHKGPPSTAPEGCRPWFEAPDRRTADRRVVFGHWAALGFHRGQGTLGLDSGCAWGGHLTAVRLDDGEVFQRPNSEKPPPA
ncbi:MAG: symmetrical bis(5'-nucleosyl)-tetraphosphatase [Acidobacteriota bacterium]